MNELKKQMEEWTNGEMVGLTGGWMDGQIGRTKNKKTDGRMDVWINEENIWLIEWMNNGKMDETD